MFSEGIKVKNWLEIGQNGQTHSATANELLSVFDHFVGSTLKGLIDYLFPSF